MTYKVWVQVEAIDEEADSFENEGLPDCLGEFDTFEEAAAFIRALPGWTFYKEGSDYREKMTT